MFLNMGKVEAYNCWDGVVNGGTGVEHFDDILSILDFPMESLESDGFAGDWDITKSDYLGPIPSDVLMEPPAIPHNKLDIAPIDATPEPKHILQHHKCTEVKEQGVFHTQSPVSVLESTGSSSSGKSLLVKSHIGKRARSKRARSSGLSPWLLNPPLFAPTKTYHNPKKNKERRKKLSDVPETIEDGGTQRPIMKKCTHCEVTKTPQWREGPLGPKTLCNACGVRYRSGRLFPEYRPAASPTFVPALHSNSHKKVIEMRTKAKQQQAVKTEETPLSPQPEFVPMSSYLFDTL